MDGLVSEVRLPYADRAEAGRILADAVAARRPAAPIVLAIPRGGVPVALAVATRLACPLDLVLVRKLGAPGDPELALGAVAGTPDRPEVRLNPETSSRYRLTEAWLRDAVDRELGIIQRRRQQWLAGRLPMPLTGRTAIVVDDGIATGATLSLALQQVRSRGPDWLMLAVPVAPPSVLTTLRPLVDEMVVPAQPMAFGAVGQFYRDFTQVEDVEVAGLLAQAPNPPEAIRPIVAVPTAS